MLQPLTSSLPNQPTSLRQGVSYTFKDNQWIPVIAEATPLTPKETVMLDSFKSWIQSEHPCAGAKRAFKDKSYHYKNFKEALQSKELLNDLQVYLKEKLSKPSSFWTFVAFFPEQQLNTEDKKLFSTMLTFYGDLGKQSLETFPLSEEQKKQAQSSLEHQHLFLAGKAFSPFELHPNHERRSRRFPKSVAVVFNLVEHFDNLKRDGVFEGLAKAIRRNDEKYSGSAYPNAVAGFPLIMHWVGINLKRYFGLEESTPSEEAIQTFQKTTNCPYHQLLDKLGLR